MPLPQPLQTLIRTRKFWTGFFYEPSNSDEDFSELEGCRLQFPIAPDATLTLSLAQRFYYLPLELKVSGRESVLIGWDDQAHWHPHVLRWSELELFCRAIALHDPELPHPGLPLLFLYRFAPICQDDDLGLIIPMLEAAWTGLGLFSPGEIRELMERVDARDSGFEWRFAPEVGTWGLHQEENLREVRALYTLRDPRNEDFPFATWTQVIKSARHFVGRECDVTLLDAVELARNGDLTLVAEVAHSLRQLGRTVPARLLEAAQTPAAIYWVVELLLGLEPGSLIRRFVRISLPLRPTVSLSLCFYLDDPAFPLPESAPRWVELSIQRVFTDLHVGMLESGHSQLRRNEHGHYVTTESSLSVRMKLEQDFGVDLLRDLLQWARVPASVRLTLCKGNEPAFDLDRSSEDRCAIHLPFAQMVTAHWELFGKLGHRFDPILFDRKTREALRNVLHHANADGPDEEGWYDVPTTDGGLVRICLQRLDEDPELDGGTAVILRLTPGSALFLHRFLAAGHLLLLPMAIATSVQDGTAIEEQWPRVTVVEHPGALYEILQLGPYGWWCNALGRSARIPLCHTLS